MSSEELAATSPRRTPTNLSVLPDKFAAVEGSAAHGHLLEVNRFDFVASQAVARCVDVLVYAQSQLRVLAPLGALKADAPVVGAERNGCRLKQ